MIFRIRFILIEFYSFSSPVNFLPPKKKETEKRRETEITAIEREKQKYIAKGRKTEIEKKRETERERK